jgi:hypothetical protein
LDHPGQQVRPPLLYRKRNPLDRAGASELAGVGYGGERSFAETGLSGEVVPISVIRHD